MRLSPKQFFLPSLIIYPSNACNLKCAMCNEGADTAKEIRRMDPDTLEELLAECSHFLVKPRVHFSGLGEPLLHPDIVALMQRCKHHGANWSMTTNGSLLETYAESILECGCHGINISIHGTGPEHDCVTGVRDSFARTLRGLNQLGDVKRSLATGLPPIAVNCVITRQNVLSLPEILEYLIDLPVNSITFQHSIFSRDDFLGNKPFVIHEKEEIDLIKQFILHVTRNKFPRKINFFPKIKIKDLDAYYSAGQDTFNRSCILPWLSARIHPDGNVEMCDEIYGNVLESSLKSIVNSDKAISFRRGLINNEFKSPKCFRCCHRHYY